MEEKRSLALIWLGRLFQIIVMGGIIVGAVSISSYWLSHRPKAKRVKRKKDAPLVEVKTLTPRNHKPRISALGNVISSREVRIASLVSGKVKWVAKEFYPGGRFNKGDRIIEIEPAEYMYTYAMRKGDLDKARAELSIEVGKKSVAERELKLMDKGFTGANRDLILRKPQEASVKAAIDSARAYASKAWLDVNRTKVNVPFNGMLLEKKVDIGSKISSGTDCGTIVGTDAFWVEVQLPRTYLGSFHIERYNSATGALVHVFDKDSWGEGVFREGRVKQLLPDLEKESKLMRVLVEIPDPLHLKKKPGERFPLLIGAMVRLTIYGIELKNVYEIHRDWDRDGSLWILGKNNQLEIRKVKSLWRGRDYIYFRTGLNPGDKLITSNLGFALPEMRLREHILQKTKGGQK
ncbi:HlyD family efflux transporter periplasmic adaptor subunit [Myxococcota bacterium]|nr:HlyD family efflux transporter periplasmic adaptor subunit [Myxococcota bacterium]MBU1536596.1 HlyD family efflux transporter periplasmic adaptor subunit [Myxococcota bacterium]